MKRAAKSPLHEAPQGSALWDVYFKVRMLYMHSRDPIAMRKFGTRVSGIEAIDRNIEKQEMVTEMTIDSMFEKYRTGVTVRLVNYGDSAKVYQIIHSHLIAWAEYLNTGVNTGGAPLKDLIELDAFANVVYDKARCVFSEEVRNTAVASNFMNIQSINFANILKRELPRVDTSMSNGVEVTRIKGSADKGDKVDGMHVRHSFRDIFSSEVDNISGWRQS